MSGVTVMTEYDVVPETAGQVLVNLRVEASSSESTRVRAGVSLTVVIDKSGSMEGESLELVKLTCEHIVRQLNESDYFSLVVYDSDVDVLVPLSIAGDVFREQALKAIQCIDAGMCTNMAGGLLQGIAEQQKAAAMDWSSLNTDSVSEEAADDVTNDESPPRRMANARGSKKRRVKRHLFFSGSVVGTEHAVKKNMLRSVFLLTDGFANIGITEPNNIVAAMHEVLTEEDKIKVYTFGFGKDHCEKLLCSICEKGGGKYYYIESKDTFVSSFSDALGELLCTSERNVKLEIKGAADVGIHVADPMLQRPDREQRADIIEVSISDLVCETYRDVLLKVVVPLIQVDGASAMWSAGSVNVSFFDVFQKQTVSYYVDIAMKRGQCELPVKDLLVALQSARLETVEAMNTAMGCADMDKIDEAQSVLRAAMEKHKLLIAEAESVGNDTVVRQCKVFVMDIEDAIHNTRTIEDYKKRGSKCLRMRSSFFSSHRFEPRF